MQALGTLFERVLAGTSRSPAEIPCHYWAEGLQAPCKQSLQTHIFLSPVRLPTGGGWTS